MYNINTQLERVNFLKKEKEKIQEEIDDFNDASGIVKFFRSSKEGRLLCDRFERIKIPQIDFKTLISNELRENLSNSDHPVT